MVQQVGNTRANKQLVWQDIARIVYASCLNFFHTDTMFPPWPFGIYYNVDMFWVRRIDESKYEYQWCYKSFSKNSTEVLRNAWCKAVTTKTSAEIEALHPDLICDTNGNERLLIECCYRKKSHYDKKKLGFFILDPQTIKSGDGESNNLFLYRLVITPKPGLFPAEEG